MSTNLIIRNTNSKSALPKNIPMHLQKKNFSMNAINTMSVLGQWLLSGQPNTPPELVRIKRSPYLILIWKYGHYLEQRHIKHYSSTTYSSWENCTMSNCILSYKSEDLPKADAVLFHMHRMRGIADLPKRTRRNQIWIFLSDESPMHTFLYNKQNLSDYNGLFNWSMTYRFNSDIPVPYGRTVLNSLSGSSQNFELQLDKIKLKNKLVAIMGSNCATNNGRWSYVKELKKLLKTDLDIYGSCLNGNKMACPGHFTQDCPALNNYKFYLAFENSNCKEYLTEKVFWNSYHKLSVPIIMGPPKEDCKRLLPPNSYLHIDDFANPSALADYIKYLNISFNKYIEYHEWRSYYKVINEHGYFGSKSKHYCRICEALNYNKPVVKWYKNIANFWNKDKDCILN
ncbi:glycoprotein 3-alpha-L-fucosyltransferase A-like isoform X2 [Prorops nasuta]|uniref:glycoprotein 3-alpha-L-fucosyltransferase A-like isoform X2 n=1 Tax=Prorops nasuta TaxID=863751 RepID=UPI0034CEAB59